MKNKAVLIGLMFAITVASAGKFDQASRNALEVASTNNAPVVPNSTPNSSVRLDFSLAVGESWDALDDLDNVIANCITGGSITGIEWTNVTVATVGASWLSEASFLFTDSAGGQGVSLAVGNGDDMAGTINYSSGGIIDFTDNGLPDIMALGDGQLVIQLFEGFDDNADAIDANYTSGIVDVYGIDIAATATCSAAFVVIPDIDLQLGITNNAMGVLALGDSVTFTQTVVNNGPDDANSTVVSSTLSAGLDYVSNSCGATVAGQVVTWAAGTVAGSGGTVMCDIVTTVADFGQSVVNASVTAGGADSVPANNVASSSVNGPARIIPTLSQYGLMFLLVGLFFVVRRRFAK